MAKVGIVTDTISCLPPEVIKEYGIGIMPIALAINGKPYRDQVEITPDEFWKIFPEMKEFTTGAPAMGDFTSVLADLAKSTDSIMCTFVAKALSATHEAAVQAVEIFKSENSGINIEIVDSNTATGAQGFIVLEAARAAARHPRVRRLLLVSPPVSLLDGSALEAIGRGVLMITGERDTIAPPPVLEKLADALPGAKLRVVPGADHFFVTGLEDRAHFDDEPMKRLLDRFVLDAGIDLLLHTRAVGVIRNGDRIEAVRLFHKGGVEDVSAEVFIDSTGDGDIAAWAGAEVEIGREQDGGCQPMTLSFRMANVDMDRIPDGREFNRLFDAAKVKEDELEQMELARVMLQEVDELSREVRERMDIDCHDNATAAGSRQTPFSR